MWLPSSVFRKPLLHNRGRRVQKPRPGIPIITTERGGGRDWARKHEALYLPHSNVLFRCSPHTPYILLFNIVWSKLRLWTESYQMNAKESDPSHWVCWAAAVVRGKWWAVLHGLSSWSRTLWHGVTVSSCVAVVTVFPLKRYTLTHTLILQPHSTPHKRSCSNTNVGIIVLAF